jgi:hypothetical protein
MPHSSAGYPMKLITEISQFSHLGKGLYRVNLLFSISRILALFLLLLLSHSRMSRAQDLFDDDIDQPSTPLEETSPQPETETPSEAPPATSVIETSPPAPEPAASTPAVETPPNVRTAQPTAPVEPVGQQQKEQKDARSRAPTESEKEQWGQNRVLGGHQFPIGAFVPLALATSYLGVRAGFEYHEVPGFEQRNIFTGEQRFITLQTVNVREDIDFALRIHEYIAIFGNAYGRGRVGANIDTLLGNGAEYTYGGDLGALVKLFRVGSFHLALRGEVGFYAGQKAGVQTLYSDLSAIALNTVNSLLNSPQLDYNTVVTTLNASFNAATADLLMPFDGLIYGASLNLALALGKYVGLQGVVGFLYDATTSRPTRFDTNLGISMTTTSTATTLRPSLSTALDFDAISIGIPMDILVEYRLTPLSLSQDLTRKTTPESTETVISEFTEITISKFTFEHLVALSFFYSGRTDLQLGITGYTLLGQAPVVKMDGPSSGKPQDFGVQPVLRYFW